ncbi:MAG: DUF5678 domain-containing protein [Blastocatellia bacterium]
MQDTAVEKIVTEFEQLSLEQQTEVFRRLEEKLTGELAAKRPPRDPRFVGHYTPKDRTKENEWLRQHGAKYAGQWVALDGDRLLGHGNDLKKVAEAAEQSGVSDAFFVRAEPVILTPQLPVTPQIIGTYTPKDRTKEHEWLRLYRDEYAWQWVALDGDRLVGHGYDLKKVAEDAKQNGVEDALFIRVEPSDALPWAGI